MENSIEEYVEILERFSNENVIYGSTVGMTLEKYKDLQLSAEHILSDYKRVLKENEEVHKENEHLHREINRRIKLKIENEKIVDTQFISIQKIKDKIEKLNSESYAEKLEDIMNIKNYTITELVQYVLQELIEEREEKE